LANVEVEDIHCREALFSSCWYMSELESIANRSPEPIYKNQFGAHFGEPHSAQSARAAF
jgi:hypothetical protein